ncbi:MAG: VWA domain-containing protein [Alphaproteobacteria bacterium]
MTKDKVPATATQSQVDAFLRNLALAPRPQRAAGTSRGRLLFAMDATASREPSWDQACEIQGDMFLETAALGGLDVQLVYYRGFREFKATPWVDSSAKLVRAMTGVACRGGQTQIGRVLGHAIAETGRRRINALVFVGDSLEEELDQLCQSAGELGLLGVPVFVFHEGNDEMAAHGFREIARLSGGAYCPFDSSSAKQLRDLLSAVAVFAAGGRKALEDYGRKKGGVVLRLTHGMRGRP